MLLKTDTYKTQQKLANYCRDGKKVNIEGSVEGRMEHYRRLVYSVVNDTLEGAFPITWKFIQDEIWEEMVYRFFREHKCQSPQVWKMAREFVEFAAHEDFAGTYKLPFLNNLLEFEWLEIELYMMEDINYPTFTDNGDWLKDRIAINPEHRLIKFDFPVHQLKPYELEEQKGEYFLLLFREKDTGKVQFVSLSVLFAFVMDRMINTEKTMEEISMDILYIFGINDITMLHQKLQRLITDLMNNGFILGFYKK